MVTIYVEGKADKRFVEHVLTRDDLLELVEDIIPMNGYSALPMFAPKIRESLDMDRKVLVICDADDDPDEKHRIIDAVSAEVDREIPRFLLPDGKNTGCLEDLLRECVVDAHRRVLGCFETYEECLREFGEYHLPNRKAMLYAYCEAMVGDSDEKRDDQRNYLDSSVWCLDSTALSPLRNFLKRAISE